jgi:hypothetical protein
MDAVILNVGELSAGDALIDVLPGHRSRGATLFPSMIVNQHVGQLLQEYNLAAIVL